MFPDIDRIIVSKAELLEAQMCFKLAVTNYTS